MTRRDRFNRFTEQAQKVLRLAQEEAQHRNQQSISTEHLLLGLLRSDECVAVNVLRKLGVDLNKVCEDVETILDTRDPISLGGSGLTPGAKRALEFAIDEARSLDHRYIGTEHLLLGLLHEEMSQDHTIPQMASSPQARSPLWGRGNHEGSPLPRNGRSIVQRLGVELESARAATLQILKEQAESIDEEK